MKLDTVNSQVSILFLIMLVGFIARKCRILNNELNNGITELTLNVTIPFSIIVAFNITFSTQILHNAITVFWVAVFSHLFAALLSLLLYHRYHPDTRKILTFATIFDNIGFVGLPLLVSLFGKLGVFYGSIYLVIFHVFVWTLGVMIFAGKKELNILKALSNPALIAVLIGAVLFFFSVRLPLPIFKTIDMVGSITTPLSMIVIGSMLAELRLRELFNDYVIYFCTAVRLLVVPLGAALILKMFGVQEHILRICILSAAMPAGTMTSIFAQKYRGNALLASRIVFISTVLSVLTIPLILNLV